jgi:hypothetical protein
VQNNYGIQYLDVLEASRTTGTDPAPETWYINFNALNNGKSPQTSEVLSGVSCPKPPRFFLLLN